MSAPSITPNPAYTTSTLSCNPGSFSEPDGDTENTGARTYRWFKNNSVISGQTSQTLASSNFGASDSIICEQTATANNWPTVSTDKTNSSELTISSSAPENATIDTYTDATNSHQFNITASVDDPDGASDIDYSNITIDTGSCAYLSNSTNANTFTVIYNCSSTTEGTATIKVGFRDSSNNQLNTSESTHDYPDAASSLSAPSITPNPAYTTSTLSCNPGSFSDPDGDTENTGARTYRWFKNKDRKSVV